MTTKALGPARTDGVGLSPARLRVAALLAELGGTATLMEMVGRLGGHPNATRSHLDALAKDGLAIAAPVARSGPGRRPLAWTLTEEGRRALAGDPTVNTYIELVSAMAAHLSSAPDSERLAERIGRTWGAERVAAPSREALVELLAELGFDPETQPSGDIRLRACPIIDAALDHPETVCAIHAGLISQASGEDSQLVPFAEPGACRVTWGRARD